MAKIDLNIIDRGTTGTEWIAENTGISSESLSKVVEMKTDNAGALNSLPTPFARFYVTKEAFRRVAEEKRNPRNEAGYAYQMIVSNCLDVIELLFNSKFHKNSWSATESISIKEWDREESMKDLKNKVPTLYNSLNTYFNSDLKEDKLYFVVYNEDGKEYLLACSSPMTLFVTPPDMDANSIKEKGVSHIEFEGEQYQKLHISSKSGREYFRSICLFEKRDEDFKNYVYNNLFGGSNVDSRFKEIQEYIKLFKDDPDIKSGRHIDVEPVMSDVNDEIVINGIQIGFDKAVDINSFFTKDIIKVPYRLSDKDVVLFPNIKADPNRTYDFLMPFRPEIMNYFDGVPDCKCHIKDGDNVVVTLNYNGKEYMKEYESDPISDKYGRIVDLGKAKQNFDLGLFPNILSNESNENNYFKILLAITDKDEEAPQLYIDKAKLSFYHKADGKVNRINEEDADTKYEYGVRQPVVRTRINNSQERQYVEYESKFYEVYNTSFEAIDVEILEHHGLVFPKWRHSRPSKQAFKYAIDLGTSNTFIARCQVGQNNLPELFNLQEPMVSYLHSYSDNPQLSLANRIEDAIFEGGKKAFITEFAPSIIDQKKYKFPIRTALCHVKGDTNRASLFNNHNIAFFYEKELETVKQEILTDIKWEDDENRLRVFVRELLLMIKSDVLQHNGDLDCTEIVWFRPLSFTGNIKDTYETVWESETKQILDIDRDKVQCITESEAPYYYFKKMNIIPNSEAVTVIDIGGGSTDFVYFEDNQPKMANSVHFGCDVLWDNGTAEFTNLRENGIYQKFISTIHFDTPKLQEINDGMESDKDATTRDIINFWLDNANDCGIIREISSAFKPVFIFHLTAILYYMASIYKDKGLKCPRTVVFSGNGSRYIDNFISNKDAVLKKFIDLVFTKVYGEATDVHLKMPEERKESTCYGGLYRTEDEPSVPECIYQGNGDKQYKDVGDIVADYPSIKSVLKNRYEDMIGIYKNILSLMKHDRILDNTSNTEAYVEKAGESIMELLDTNFKKDVQQKYAKEDIYFGSVFFLPIIDKVYQLTKI
ncbi:hypothetical protein PRBRB14_21980 [Hallella multisaccharivorax DSM 17128]|uniref:Ppx/GppA phosphatase N-terminal domain-containing protein n=1 Tax=Hallella multisaccharivorax DSM 17128 TaxID=688246 RepID=F8N7I1_9BACT|nr:hypothetical protein [Hallella multisaccharivorax]EGN57441.1 hypothetical protein Premu_2047 [Hallella multisaccharivorax DSM 17128]GJG31319.1 hypothetical protein PRBRB14_21980 [Hallella multisaccharivorax DSM 17128]